VVLTCEGVGGLEAVAREKTAHGFGARGLWHVGQRHGVVVVVLWQIDVGLAGHAKTGRRDNCGLRRFGGITNNTS